MKRNYQRFLSRVTRCVALVALLGGMAVLQPSIAAVPALTVVGSDGAPVAAYRWVIEEDTTYPVEPGVLNNNPLSINFHSSYMPVVASGDETVPFPNLDPDKRYFISVLPDEGYTNGGAPIALGQTAVTVTVNKYPLPTAQISVFVFEDNNSLNGAPDLPEEHGLAGFSILLFDAAGQYGAAGGQVSVDAFGNPLGTTYDTDGDVLTPGDGTFTTDANGEVLIQNLAPGKYGVQAVPPGGVPQPGAVAEWIQTSTIEGSKTIDAWVKANEPKFFTEFGPPGVHVFLGFVQATEDTDALDGTNTISGQIVNLHNARPPDFTFYNGSPNSASTCWVGLNDMAVGVGNMVYAQRCDADNNFSIAGVPEGNYQLIVWDDHLLQIIALYNITIDGSGICSTPTGSCDLIQVPVFQWFARLEHNVFFDRNGNGFRDCVTELCNDNRLDDVGMPEQNVNLRFRDGRIYQAFPTDVDGFVPFDEVFPFFNWLVAEVDFARFKATGATIIVDAGGPVDPDDGWVYPSRDQLTPQPQFEADGVTEIVNPNTGNNLSQTEMGPVLTRAFQGFLGQTSIIDWGKANYTGAENGGISGIVFYAVTRAENDPALAAAEEWEPGIPRVQVNLYRDFNKDKVIDNLNGNLVPGELADVDNYPFGWANGEAKGAEDIERTGNIADGLFDMGDAERVTTTDSWDDNKPAGCQGEVFTLRGVDTDCYDGLRNFNQVRPGVFDGGYAFGPMVTGDDSPQLVPGTYIVEAVPPPGYEILKEQDKNVDFGDEYQARAFALPPPCVGDPNLVPPELDLFPGVESFYAGQTRPLCDRKQVVLAARSNAPADFWMFTEAPIAAHFVGFILDDLSNEFDPSSPNFGEKFAPPFLPVSIRDFTGSEINRIYSDEFGVYNGLLPSTFAANIPMPSGMSPQMATLCMNDPGPVLDPGTGNMVIDPHFNKQYSQFCYTFQFMPGATTYLDTPVLPIAAFAGPDQFALDCEFENGTPRIYSVTGAQNNGPYIRPNANNANRTLTIVSMGQTSVLNPAYDGPEGTQTNKFITRDYGFGNALGQVTVSGIPLTNVTWNDGIITGRVPVGTPSGQLVVTRADGKSTTTGVWVTTDIAQNRVRQVQPSAVPGATPIQDAIDLAGVGDLVLVAPGTYEELVVMWKAVQLQGAGEGSTTINATRAAGEKLQAWIDKVQGVIDNPVGNSTVLLPGQAPEGGGTLVEAGEAFVNEQGPGVFVLAANTGPNSFNANRRPRIDGFTITAANQGGGILANGYANFLRISNNNVTGNQGVYGGGVRIGHTALVEVNDRGTPINNSTALNRDINILNNRIAQNGSLAGAGGGVSIGTGSDRYRVAENFICGNFAQGHGGGIGHLGLSQNGVIENNKIIFNQSFAQDESSSGGGIFIGGTDPAAFGQALTPGSGNVLVNRNLIQGNLAGAGDGGGIRTSMTNGQDVGRTPNNPNPWFRIQILNNMIVNNVAGLAGGGISMQDSARIDIIHNTIANNDSTATAGAAFVPGNPNASTPQPAGIVSRAHSTGLTNAFHPSRIQFFSNPRLFNDIIWHNRSFSVAVDTLADPPAVELVPAPGSPVYSDLAVLGTALPDLLNPRSSILTDTLGYHGSNISADPVFLAEYVNGARNSVVEQEFTTAIQIQPAFDEGGNFIDVRFGPLSLRDPDTGDLFGNYHINIESSPARAAGNSSILSAAAALAVDFDADPRPRPIGTAPDIGSDEVAQAAPLALLNRLRLQRTVRPLSAQVGGRN